jgi:hypothetical protein
VDDIWKKLQKIHCAIAVVTDVNGPLFEFMPDEVEMLARHEHDRWMKDKQALGWKYGTEINERKRTHNCLVPWEYLPDQQKEKDRDAIRSLPGILLKVRLKIVRFERS